MAYRDDHRSLHVAYLLRTGRPSELTKQRLTREECDSQADREEPYEIGYFTPKYNTYRSRYPIPREQ